MVVAKTEIEFFFKNTNNKRKKRELAGERYPASHFTVVVGFPDKMCIRKKNLKQKGKIHQQTTTLG